MTRGNTLLENISKLNTFIHMIKSNEFLSIYIEKIINNKSKSIKFINDFDHISLDLLYTSLQIMNYKDKVTKEVFNKINDDFLNRNGFIYASYDMFKYSENIITNIYNNCFYRINCIINTHCISKI